MARFEKVLYFVDGESTATDPIRLAVARAGSIGAHLTLASVVPPAESSILGDRLEAGRLEQLSVEAEQERLEKLADLCREPDSQISTRVLVGHPAVTIVRAVVSEGYQMIWKAPAESSRLRDRILGSTDMRLLRACPCPVAIVGSHRPEEGRQVTVAAVDVASASGREDSNDGLNEKILDLSLAALAGDTELHVVHAWSLYGESVMRSPRAHVKREDLDAMLEEERVGRREKLEKLVESYRTKLTGRDAERFAPEIHLVKGDPSTAIPAALEQLGADLLVMGTISRTGRTGFVIGNTAERILDSVKCSVAVTKPDGFVTPVPV